MLRIKLVGMSLVVLLAGAPGQAQPNAPTVMMSVTLPDQEVRYLVAPESGLATTTLMDGSQWGFRPTIRDSKPWTRVTVTIFKLGPNESEVGEVQLSTGGAGMASKTLPPFKITITKVEPPQQVPSRT